MSDDERPSCATTRLAWASARGSVVAAYGTDRSVVLASGAALVVQQVIGPFDGVVAAVELQHETLSLAVAAGSSVHVYELDRADRARELTLCWRLLSVIEAPCGLDEDVLALAWAPPASDGRFALWTAGSSLALCTAGASAPARRVRLPAPAVLLACSPDGRLVATCGASDRSVRVWQQQPQQALDCDPPGPTGAAAAGEEADGPDGPTSGADGLLECVVLTHFSPVQTLSWRPIVPSSEHVSAAALPAAVRPAPRNALLTASADGVGRVWSECEPQPGQPFGLSVCLVLDADGEAAASRPLASARGAAALARVGAGGDEGVQTDNAAPAAAYAWLREASPGRLSEHAGAAPGDGGACGLVQRSSGGVLRAFALRGLCAHARRTPAVLLLCEAASVRAAGAQRQPAGRGDARADEVVEMAALAEAGGVAVGPAPGARRCVVVLCMLRSGVVEATSLCLAPALSSAEAQQAAERAGRDSRAQSARASGEVEAEASFPRSRAAPQAAGAQRLPPAAQPQQARQPRAHPPRPPSEPPPPPPQLRVEAHARASLGGHAAGSAVCELRPHATLPLLLSRSAEGEVVLWAAGSHAALDGGLGGGEPTPSCAQLREVARLPVRADVACWASVPPPLVPPQLRGGSPARALPLLAAGCPPDGLEGMALHASCGSELFLWRLVGSELQPCSALSSRRASPARSASAASAISAAECAPSCAAAPPEEWRLAAAAQPLSLRTHRALGECKRAGPLPAHGAEDALLLGREAEPLLWPLRSALELPAAAATSADAAAADAAALGAVHTGAEAKGGGASGAAPRPHALACALSGRSTLVVWAVVPCGAADGAGEAGAQQPEHPAHAPPLRLELVAIAQLRAHADSRVVDCKPAAAIDRSALAALRGAGARGAQRGGCAAWRSAPLLSLSEDGTIGLSRLELGGAPGASWQLIHLAVRTGGGSPLATPAGGSPAVAASLAMCPGPAGRLAVCSSGAAVQLLETTSSLGAPAHEQSLCLAREEEAPAAAQHSHAPPTVLGSSAAHVHGSGARRAPSAAGSRTAERLASAARDETAVAAWHLAWGGQRLLAACAGPHVRVLAQGLTAGFVRRGAPWSVVASAEMRERVGCAAWTADGWLLVGCGSSLHVLAHIGHAALSGLAALDARLPGGALRSLPPYHPRSLEEDVLAGRGWRVERVLARLAADLAAAATGAREADEAEEGGAGARRAGAAATAVLSVHPLADLLTERQGGGAAAEGAEQGALGRPAGASAAGQEADESVAAAAAREAAELAAAEAAAAAAAEAERAQEVVDLFAPAPISQAAPPPPAQPAGVAAATDGGGALAAAAAVCGSLGSIALFGLSRQDQRRLLRTVDVYTRLHEHLALDECALRFLIRVKLAADARHARGGGASAPLVRMADVVWALHSECQQALLDLCLSADSAGPTAYAWASVCAIGGGLWLCTSPLLRPAIERVAKAQFSLRREPDDAAPFYLALGKKASLLALYKAARNDKLVAFLSNDFETERWQGAALKNAYALIGKRSWGLAVSFFLLGKQWRDAAMVAAKHMADVQLALVIAALAPDDAHAELQHVLSEFVLGGAAQPGAAGGSALGGGADGCSATERAWAECVAALLLRKPAEAYAALSRSCATERAPPQRAGEEDAHGRADGWAASGGEPFAPSVREYLQWLGAQPQLRRLGGAHVPASVHAACAYAYAHAGCALLGLGAACDVGECAGELVPLPTVRADAPAADAVDADAEPGAASAEGGAWVCRLPEPLDGTAEQGGAGARARAAADACASAAFQLARGRAAEAARAAVAEAEERAARQRQQAAARSRLVEAPSGAALARDAEASAAAALHAAVTTAAADARALRALPERAVRESVRALEWQAARQGLLADGELAVRLAVQHAWLPQRAEASAALEAEAAAAVALRAAARALVARHASLARGALPPAGAVRACAAAALELGGVHAAASLALDQSAAAEAGGGDGAAVAMRLGGRRSSGGGEAGGEHSAAAAAGVEVEAAVALCAFVAAWSRADARALVALCGAQGRAQLRAAALGALAEAAQPAGGGRGEEEEAAEAAGAEAEATAEATGCRALSAGARLVLLCASADATERALAAALGPRAACSPVAASVFALLRALGCAAELALATRHGGAEPDAPTLQPWASAWAAIVRAPAEDGSWAGAPRASPSLAPSARAPAAGDGGGGMGSGEVLRARGEFMRALCAHPTEAGLLVLAPSKGLLLVDAPTVRARAAPGAAALPPAEGSTASYHQLLCHPSGRALVALAESALHLWLLTPPAALDAGGDAELSAAAAAAVVAAGARDMSPVSRAIAAGMPPPQPPRAALRHVGPMLFGPAHGAPLRDSLHSAAAHPVRAAFDARGTKLAVGDAAGRVSLWAWGGPGPDLLSRPPCAVVTCLSRRVADVGFVSSTVLAACAHAHGTRDAGKDGVPTWSASLVDFLLPPSRAVVGGVALPDGSGHCLLPLGARPQVLVGSKRGDLSLWDLRTHRVVHTWAAHAGASVRSLALARGGDVAVSGASDGSLKLWDVRALAGTGGANADSEAPPLSERWASAKHHEKHTMLQPLLGHGPGTTHGVTAIATSAAADVIFTCGADGRVLALAL